MFVFLAVPKACPLSIICLRVEGQSVSGLAPLGTENFGGSGNREGRKTTQKLVPQLLILTSFWEAIEMEPPLPMDNIYAKQYLVQVGTRKPGQSM